MKIMRLVVLFAAFALIGSRVPSLAHHSPSAEFDRKKAVTLTGVVTKVEWVNPHAWFYVDVKDPRTGDIMNWAFELVSPNSLERRGWSKDTLKTGDVVSVDGFLSRDGGHKVDAQRVRLSDGRSVLTNSAEGSTTR
jgi:hypothetical protein